jgi:mRNA interferase MazF
MAEGLRRGDIVVCSPPGEYGKPRPAVILQADILLAVRDSVTLCLVTSTPVEAPLFRVAIEAGHRSGIDRPSFAMADKLMTVSKGRVTQRLGRLSKNELGVLEIAVSRWLGLAPIA